MSDFGGTFHDRAKGALKHGPREPRAPNGLSPVPGRESVRGVGGISMPAASTISHKERAIQTLAPEAGGPGGAGSDGASLLQEHGGRDASSKLAIG